MIAILGLLALVTALALIALRHNDWLPERTYRSGTGWCVWRWSYVDTGYITRLHLFKTPWCALCLHWLNKPDPEPYLHDHPVTFLSVILRGGYSEIRTRPGNSGPRSDSPGSPFDRAHHRWFNFIRATPEDRHTICAVEPKTLTLAFMGPKRREWGFHRENGRWQGWKSYYAEKRAAAIAQAGSHYENSSLYNPESQR